MAAFDLFSQYGIKSVSMDDIAHTAAISKRTLYEFFSDKETLLVEGIEYTHARFGSYIARLEQEPHTAVDIILLVYQELMHQPRWYARKFYEDLKKYPKAMKKKETEKASFGAVCSRLFDRGVKEEVFQADVNFNIVILLAKEQLQMTPPPMSLSQHSNEEVYCTVLTTFLRGISTDKGRAILDRWVSMKFSPIQ